MIPLLALLPKAKIAGLVIGGLLIAGAGGYVLWLRAANADLRAERAQIIADRDAAADAAERNLQALETVRADAAAAQEALAAERRRSESRIRELATLRGMIEHAAADRDGPVAPVLAETLDGLRGRR